MNDKPPDREEMESRDPARAASLLVCQPRLDDRAAMNASATVLPPTPGSSRRGSLPLVFSLLVLAFCGWSPSVWSDTQDEPEQAAEYAPELAAVEARMDELAGQLATEREERRQLLERHEALGGELERLSARLDELESRLGEATATAEARGAEDLQLERDLQRHIAMLEAAALLRIGQERAELGGDLHGARLAYRRAEELLARGDDARLDRVRRLLAQELESLESAQDLDLGRAMARLDRLARESRGWPTLLGHGAGEPMPRGDDEEPEHWRERVAGAARGLVRVQARDDLGRTQEQFEAAREQLQLRLVAAQLALTRRDAGALELHLAAAIELLDDWFDPAANDVVQARGELSDLSELGFEQDVPDLGEALNRLHAVLGGS